MAPLLKPKALKVPISPRSSSTIRVMEVRLISTATSRKITGNTLPTASMEDRSLIMLE
ncbi:hypothetical protein D3C86_2066570 [compost metagenome]